MAKAIKTISVATPSGTNITGLLSYQGLNFSEDIEIRRGPLVLITGAGPGGEVDVYPGVSDVNGDIVLTANQPDLEIGEILVMEDRSVMKTCIAAPTYSSVGPKPFSVRVWAEKNGHRVNNPSVAVVALYEGPDTLVYSFAPNSSPNARGIFTFQQNGLVLTRGKDYYLDLQITVDSVIVESNRAFIEL